jgi:succinate dehydrogenase/fumarate reductase flavoprotein subunit
MSHETFDVIVCGYGGAGAAAAIEASDAGARVLIAEKMPEGGGSTQESGGSLATIRDRDGAVEHYLALTEGRTPRAVMETYVDGVADLPRWIGANGGELERLPMARPPFPHRYEGSAYANFPRADSIGDRVRLAGVEVSHGGTTLWRFLERNVSERAIEVRYGLAANSLVVDGAAVRGVEFKLGGQELTVRAEKAVVLACGGFAANAKMLGDAVAPGISYLSPPGRNMGDGVRMAQEIGADLWHMNCVAAGFGYQVAGLDAAWMCSIPAFGFFMVDRDGRRFLNEPAIEHHAANHALLVREVHTGEFRRMPSYLIFDETTRLAGRIATVEAGYNRHFGWSEDNSAEVEKGWIKQADTIDELADLLGIPGPNLEQTWERYNAGCESGDDERGRSTDTLVPLATPPFYGIEVRPSLFNTQGGPRRNEQGEILSTNGSAIPGLFSAGELGSIWAALYPGAGNVTEALVTGRIAGRNAAQRSP